MEESESDECTKLVVADDAVLAICGCGAVLYLDNKSRTNYLNCGFCGRRWKVLVAGENED